MNLLLPYISGKRYFSSFLVFLILFFLFLKQKQPLNKVVWRLIVLAVAESLSNVISILVGGVDYSYKELLFNFIFILIPFSSYYCGLRLMKRKGNKGKSVEKILLTVTIVECLVGAFQIIVPAFRVITLQLYSSLEKYSQTFAGGLVRIVGTFGNPNNYACFVAILSCLNLHFFLQSKRHGKSNISIIIIMVVATIVIVFSQSKTAAALYLLLMAYALLDINNMKRVVLFSIIIGLAIFIMLKNSSIEGIFAEYLNSADNLTLGGRKNIWIKYLDTFKTNGFANILFGNGPSFYKNIDTSVDNAYLDVLIASGLFGLSIFFAKPFALLSRSDNECVKKAKKIVILGILILSVTSQLDLISAIAYYLVIGAIDSMSVKKKAIDNEPSRISTPSFDSGGALIR